jgi:hypothetical protein
MKIKIYRPKNQTGFYHHKNDSFRELLEIWEELEYIELIDYEGRHVWLNSIGDVLLYDRPTLEWLEPDLKYNLGLFGNPELPQNGKNNHHWIFWARHPKILNQNIKTRKVNNTIFIGNIENSTQLQYRDSKWEDVIDRFEIVLGKEHKYENLEYLKIIGSYKYGLCLRGYGPKCHREIELMRFGTVPILTPECSTKYYNQLQEDVHYIKVSTPEELQQKLENLETKEYKKLSTNCKKWYEKNSSPEGSFQITKEIVDSNLKFKNHKQLESICTYLTRECEQDFIQLMLSIKKYFSNTMVYVLCDSYIEKWFSDINNPKVIFINNLDKYQGLGRPKMESDGIWMEFSLKKTEIIDYALKLHNNTLYVDSDIVFLNSNLNIDFEKQVGLSPQFISKSEQEKYGIYNCGFVYISDSEVTKYWREADHNNYYLEQGILNTFPDKFSYFEFSELNNFGFWRVNNVEQPDEVKKQISFIEGKHYFKGKEVNSLHIHQFDPKYKFFTSLFNLPKFTLIVQYYNDKNLKRQNELDQCLIKNLENPIFKKIINLVENKTDVPGIIKNHDKYQEYRIENRLSYQEAFNYCNQNLKYENVILSNLDIIFNHESELSISKNQVVALSRVENNSYDLLKSIISQDAWIFIPPIKIDNCNFELGSLGCDNAISDRINKSGYQILNRGSKLLSFHIDNVRSINEKNDNYIKKYIEKEGYLLIPDYDHINYLKIEPKLDYKLKIDYLNSK